MAHEQIAAESELGKLREKLIRDFVKGKIILHDRDTFLGVADIDL